MARRLVDINHLSAKYFLSNKFLHCYILSVAKHCYFNICSQPNLLANLSSIHLDCSLIWILKFDLPVQIVIFSVAKLGGVCVCSGENSVKR